jgi:hypothetical protein
MYQPFWAPIGVDKFYSSVLEFEWQAGHEYVINGDIINDLPIMWAEDITTEQTVTHNTAVYHGYGYHSIECKDDKSSQVPRPK